MAFASVAALLDVLRQVPLLEPEQMTEIHRLATSFREPRSLAGELVRHGWLTPYQVNQMFQGRARQLLLGPYVLLERLGEGGMGQVFKARQRKLGRIVALKVIRKERLDNPDAVRRFRREIQAAAQLSHPNIVLALDADEYEGSHLFAMEYVEGIDLAKYVKQKGPLPVAQACDFIRQAALGLQHAHERGMVHRDIKPHNLLLVPQTGLVKVLDMGLARLHSEASEAESSTSLTAEGTVMGTPDYIAPEQAMDSRSADIRADLYSLGCTLYFLLTGRVPFPGGTIMEKLFRHQTEPPRSVRDYRPDVSPTVAALVQRLMAKRPTERFQTPAELSAALIAVLTPGAPVPALAVPISASATRGFEEAQPKGEPLPPLGNTDTAPFADLRDDTIRMEIAPRKDSPFLQPKRLLLFSAAAGMAIVALVLLLVLMFNRSAPDEPFAEDATRSGVETVSAEAADKEWKTLRARGEASGVDPVKFREELLAFRQAHPGTRAALEAAEHLMYLPSPFDHWSVTPLAPGQKLDGQPKELLAVLGDHRSWIGISPGANRTYAQHSLDGRWVACNASDGTIRLLHPDDLTIKAALKAEEPQFAFDFRRDGKMMATCGLGSIVLWDLSGDQPRQLRVLKVSTRINAVAVSPDGRRLAASCGGEQPTVHLWDISAEPRVLAVLKGHTGVICKPAFSPDGKTLATGSLDKTVRIWDLSGAKPKERAVLKDHAYWVVCVTFSPDGKLLASCGQHDYTLRLWDVTGAEPKEVTVGHMGEATNDAVFSPDGKRLACGFWGGHWLMWDVSERRFNQLASVPDHDELVWSLSFAPDGRTLATTSDVGTVHLWHVHEMPPRQCFVSPGHGQPVTGLVFTPDEKTLVSLSGDGTVRLWDLKEWPPRERAKLEVQRGQVCGAIAPDGRTLVTGDATNAKRVYWDLASGKELRSAPGRMWIAAYSPDGKTLVSAEDNNALRYWDTASGEQQRLEQNDQPLSAICFSPDGRSLAAGDWKGNVQILPGNPVKTRVVCRGPDGSDRCLTFRPDGKLLATGGKDGRVRLYDPATGRERSSFPGHEKAICFLAFTADGKQLVSAGKDGQILLRDNEGKVLQTVKIPLPIYSAALTSDGRHLAVGNVDGTIYFLRLATFPATRR